MEAPAQAEDQSALVHDEEIWFPDGNVILVAQGRAFKVYQGLLSRDSEVFRDLFAVPQPSSVEGLDGCPIVHLTDNSEALRHVLRLIFHGERHYRADEQLEFAVVAAIIRLSHKYQLEYMRDDFLGRMKSCFSTDLAVWETVSHNHGSSAMKFGDTDAIAVVNIARLTGADSMLPAALYLCCQLDAAYIISGYRRTSDDSIESLSLDDVATCINARQSLFRRGLLDALDIFDPSRICHGNDKYCRSVINSSRQNCLAQRVDVLVALLSESRPNLRSINHKESQGALCRICADALRGAEQKAYKHNWENLPQHLCVDAPADWPKRSNALFWSSFQ